MRKKKAYPMLSFGGKSAYPPAAVKKKREMEKPALAVNQPPAGPAKPRQRGRPRKIPLDPEAAVKREESVNNRLAIVKVLLRSLKDRSKPMATVNNGFTRGLKPDTIVAGFLYEGELMFAVKFKNRKLPEIISSNEMKQRAPSLLIHYYAANLQYTYND